MSISNERPSTTKEGASTSRNEILPSFLDSETLVTFLIGPEKKTFRVHKKVIDHYSKSALEGNSIEGQTQTYALPETNIEAFRMFVQWLYRQKIHVTYFDENGTIIPELEIKKKIEAHPDFKAFADDKSLADLWIFGDRYDIWELQNDVMDTWVDLFRTHGKSRVVPVDIFAYMYANSGEESNLRRYMFKMCALIERKEFMLKKELWRELPHELLVDYIGSIAMDRSLRGNEEFENLGSMWLWV